MKIIKKDVKHNIITVKPETEDDLWVLEKIVMPGDLISGKTIRGIEIERGDKREKVKKTIFVKISAEKVEYSENQLRVGGKIIEGPEDVSHSYHTFEIKVGNPVTIEKEWSKYMIDELYAARKKREPILICVLDDEEASFALLTERLKQLTTIKGVTGKSLGEADKRNYYKELVKYMEDVSKRFGANKIILAGPGFTKENLIKQIKDDFRKKIFVDTVAHTGETGIQEVLKRGIVDKIIKDSSISEETQLVEKFFEEISKNGPVTYGEEEVKKAVDMGAVEKLLISDTFVRRNEQLLKSTEQKGGSVKIISTEHEAGKRLENMGGIAAFLRYKISD